MIKTNTLSILSAPGVTIMLHKSTHLTRLTLVCACAFVLMLGTLSGLSYAQAQQAHSPNAIYSVTSTNSGGTGSLRQAILMANMNPGADTINFNLTGCPCVISLSLGLPIITETLTIAGPGVNQLAIDGNNSVRLFNSADVPLTISNLTMQHGNTAGKGGAIRTQGVLTLTNVNVLDNSSGDNGGGVYSENDVTLSGGRFENNHITGSFGGALYADYILSVSGTQFINNSADSDGGAIYASYVYMNNGYLAGNQSISSSGAAIEASEVHLTETVFISNTAFDHGGAIQTTYAVINGGSFESNQSIDGGGGGLYAYSSVTVNGTQFISNTASQFGGGLYADGELTLVNAEFIGNISLDNGGGAYASGETLVNGGRFENNIGGGDGGGALATGNILTVNGTQFVSNTNPSSGGGAVYTMGSVQVNGARFERNYGYGSGGAINSYGGLINNSTFISNVAGYVGGGMYAAGTLTATGNTFIANNAPRGGAVYNIVGDALFVNSLFARNTATISGTALYFDLARDVHFIHNTIASPTLSSGAAIYITTGTLHITNTIIASQSIGVHNIGGIVIPRFNLSYNNGAITQGPITGASNNITGDPRFANPALDNYHLITGSAAIDAGTNAGITFDFDGDSRSQDAGYDIGYDEFAPRYIYLPFITK